MSFFSVIVFAFFNRGRSANKPYLRHWTLQLPLTLRSPSKESMPSHPSSSNDKPRIQSACSSLEHNGPVVKEEEEERFFLELEFPFPFVVREEHMSLTNLDPSDEDKDREWNEGLHHLGISFNSPISFPFSLFLLLFSNEIRGSGFFSLTRIDLKGTERWPSSVGNDSRLRWKQP